MSQATTNNQVVLITGLPPTIKPAPYIGLNISGSNEVKPFYLKSNGDLANYWRIIPAGEYVVNFVYTKA